MTRRELNVAIFEGTADQVLWQPRIETWTNHHRAHGTLPARFRGMENRQIYDALRCSIRYGPYNPIEHIADSEASSTPARPGAATESQPRARRWASCAPCTSRW